MKNFQKQLKICISAILLLLVLVLTSSTVSAAGAKSLKLNKKKATLTVGKTLKLKATVKPKKAKVTWSSNRKAVASVSKTGVVKAKKKGTAKITAKSGKKKATCKVTVKNAPKKNIPPANTAVKELYSIHSVSVIDPKVVRVTLTKEKALTKSDFVVKVKAEGNGSYNKTLAIEKIQNSGNKVYDIILSTPDIGEDGNYVSYKDYVEVTCSKLNGTKTMEALYNEGNNPMNTYVEGVVGRKINDCTIDFEAWLQGYCTYAISELPAGLKAVKRRDYVCITGTPTTVSKGVKVTITAKDEMGKTLTREVYFYIGDSDTLVTYAKTEMKTVLRGDERSEYVSIDTVGGSGSYTLTLTESNSHITVEDSNGIYIDDTIPAEDSNGIYIDDTIPAGTYNIPYTVTDSNGKSASGTVKITVENAVRVSGNIKAIDNSGIPSANVYMEFDDKENKYYDNYTRSISSDNGEYSLYVPASKSYTAGVIKGGITQYQYGVNIGNTSKVLDFVLPVYRISLTADNQANLEEVCWYQEDSNIGYGNTLYLKAGTYNIKGSSGIYNYTANITVKENATVTVTAVSRVKDTLTLDRETSVFVKAEESYYAKFQPTESGMYEFRVTASDEWLEVYLYEGPDANISLSNKSDDVYDSEPIKVLNQLDAGKTYYLRIDSDSRVYSRIKVTKKPLEVLSLGNAKNISLGEETWVSFTPSTSGFYDIQISEATAYVYAEMYSGENMYELIIDSSNGYDPDYGEDPLPLIMENQYLEENQIYYILISAASAVDVDITVTETEMEMEE